MANQFDLARIQAETNIVSIEHHKVIGSTSDCAIDFTRNLSEAPEIVFPRLILADSQTAGRGQRNRQWISSAGSLTLTLCIHAQSTLDRELEGLHAQHSTGDETGFRPARRDLIDPASALFVGLAVCEAVDLFLDGERMELKWPNDVLLRGRKLAGILLERVPLVAGRSGVSVQEADSAVTIIGIGLNANNEPTMGAVNDDPDGCRPSGSIAPISLRSAFERTFDLTNLTIAIVKRILEFQRSMSERRSELLEDCERRMIFKNGTVTVLLPSRNLIRGRYVGLSELGELRLLHDSVESRIQSGSVVSWD